MANAKFSKSTGGIYPAAVYKTFPEDALDIPDEIYAQFQNGTLQGALDVVGGVVVVVGPAAPTQAEIDAAKVNAAESAIQSHLDTAARAKGYDGILSAASYGANPIGTPFQAEGAAFALWRAQCWAKAYVVLADVKAGTRTEPTAEQLIAEMPLITLPA